MNYTPIFAEDDPPSRLHHGDWDQDHLPSFALGTHNTKPHRGQYSERGLISHLIHETLIGRTIVFIVPFTTSLGEWRAENLGPLRHSRETEAVCSDRVAFEKCTMLKHYRLPELGHLHNRKEAIQSADP